MFTISAATREELPAVVTAKKDKFELEYYAYASEFVYRLVKSEEEDQSFVGHLSLKNQNEDGTYLFVF